ncbi:tetratricopeptide repeat protein [uncultured Croceitalea sp.]|uniref:tetratricopeptide repeat protein n=1 Tax=uncultured Croceitalea sp. TaxID=1798908 RepID=UPI0033056FB3
MKTRKVFLVLFLFSPVLIYTQLQGKDLIDSLTRVYNSQPEDYKKVQTSARLFYAEIYTNPKRGEKHARNCIRISEKINYTSGITVGLFHIGVYFDLIHQIDSSKYYYSKALEHAQDSNDDVMIAKSSSVLAGIAQSEGDFDKAIKLSDRANAHFVDVKDYLSYGVGIGNRAMIFTDKGDYKTAIEQSLFALKVLDTIDREVYRKADINSQIGDIEMQRGNFVAAIAYYKKALTVFVETEDNIYVSNTHIKIGDAYASSNNYKKAKEYLELGLKLAREYDIKDNLQQALANLGTIYVKEGLYSKALTNLNESLSMSEMDSLSVNHIAVLNQIGHAYIKKGAPRSAVTYLNKAVKKASSIGANYQLKIAYEQRAHAFHAMNLFEKSLEDTQLYIKLSDSLDNVQNSRQIEELKTIYETEKKEAAIALQEEEIKTLNQEVEISNLKKGLYAGGMASALALFGLSVFGFRQRIKKNRIAREKQEEIYKQEIEHKKKELTSQTLHLVQKNTFIQELMANLDNVKNSPEKFKTEFRRIVMLLKKENASDKDWEVFKTYFAEVHNDFDQKLKTLYADISEKEIRLAAFLRMNLTTKEIAATLNVLPDSILKSKYRLKKKLGLDKETDLNQFLNAL